MHTIYVLTAYIFIDLFYKRTASTLFWLYKILLFLLRFHNCISSQLSWVCFAWLWESKTVYLCYASVLRQSLFAIVNCALCNCSCNGAVQWSLKKYCHRSFGHEGEESCPHVHLPPLHLRMRGEVNAVQTSWKINSVLQVFLQTNKKRLCRKQCPLPI